MLRTILLVILFTFIVLPSLCSSSSFNKGTQSTGKKKPAASQWMMKGDIPRATSTDTLQLHSRSKNASQTITNNAPHHQSRRKEDGKGVTLSRSGSKKSVYGTSTEHNPYATGKAVSKGHVKPVLPCFEGKTGVNPKEVAENLYVHATTRQHLPTKEAIIKAQQYCGHYSYAYGDRPDKVDLAAKTVSHLNYAASKHEANPALVHPAELFYHNGPQQ